MLLIFNETVRNKKTLVTKIYYWVTYLSH